MVNGHVHLQCKCVPKIVKTDSAQRSSNKCKKYLLKNYS